MDNLILAITGPSGAGKTTIGNMLVSRNGFVYPIHTTTRNPRSDDQEGFYRYLSHYEFKQFADSNKFMFWSGDHTIISSVYGNYYGILNQDYRKVSNNRHILMYISYKDIPYINSLIEKGYNIQIINLKYKNIEENLSLRLIMRNPEYSPLDIEKRLICAINYEKMLEETIQHDNMLEIYTDTMGEEETYKTVVKKLERKL